MTEATPPKGVVALLISPAGRVCASVQTFDQACPQGSDLYETQEYLARMSLSGATVAAFCSRELVEAADGYLCEMIVKALIEKKGYRIEYIPIGHDDEEESA